MLVIYVLASIALVYGKPQTSSVTTAALNNPLLSQNLLQTNPLSGSLFSNNLYSNSLLGNGFNTRLLSNSMYNPSMGYLGNGLNSGYGMNSLYANSLLGNSMYGMNPNLLMGANALNPLSSSANLNLLSSGLTSNSLLNRGQLLGLSGIGMNGLGSYNSGLGTLSPYNGLNGMYGMNGLNGMYGLNGLNGFNGLSGFGTGFDGSSNFGYNGLMGSGLSMGPFGGSGFNTMGLGTRMSSLVNNMQNFGPELNAYASLYGLLSPVNMDNSQANKVDNPIDLGDAIVNRVKAIVAEKSRAVPSQETDVMRTNRIRLD